MASLLEEKATVTSPAPVVPLHAAQFFSQRPMAATAQAKLMDVKE
jgi:hypothetical protein